MEKGETNGASVIAERELGVKSRVGACCQASPILGPRFGQIRWSCAQRSTHRRLIIADARLESLCHQYRLGPTH